MKATPYILYFLSLLLSSLTAQDQQLLVVKSGLIDVVQDDSNILWYLDNQGILYRHNSIVETPIEDIPRFNAIHRSGVSLFAHSSNQIWRCIDGVWSHYLDWPNEVIESAFFNDDDNCLIATEEHFYSIENKQISQCREQRISRVDSGSKTLDAEYIDANWYILELGRARKLCGSSPRTIVSSAYFVDLFNNNGKLGLVKENHGPFVYYTDTLASYFPDSTLNFPSVRYGSFIGDKYVSIDPYEIKALAANGAILSRSRLNESFYLTQVLANNILGYNDTGILNVNIAEDNQEPSTTLTNISLDGNQIDGNKTIEIQGGSAQLEIELESVYWGTKKKPKFYYRAPPQVDTWQEWDAMKSLRLTIDQSIKSVELQQVFDNKSKKLLAKPLTFHIVSETNNLPWLVAFSSLFLLMIGALIAARGVAKNNANHAERIEKITLQKQFAEEQLKSMQLQMNPHFLFNVLNSIQGLITIGEYKQAKTSLNAFAQLMRSMLNNSAEQSIRIEEEVSLLTKYLSLEQICRPDKFDYNFEIDSNINQELTIPSMIIQPFVENAIIHGIRWKSTKGMIIIKMSNHPKGIKCQVIDDGIGRQASTSKKESSHKSLGLSIVKKRLSSYFRFSDGLDTIKFEDLYDNQKNPIGTSVNIILPKL